MRAKKKPVWIDFEITESVEVLKKFVESFGDRFEDHFLIENEKLKVKTLEGTSYDVTTDDVIIKGVKGEYYPCKKDIFIDTYEVDAVELINEILHNSFL